VPRSNQGRNLSFWHRRRQSNACGKLAAQAAHGHSGNEKRNRQHMGDEDGNRPSSSESASKRRKRSPM